MNAYTDLAHDYQKLKEEHERVLEDLEQARREYEGPMAEEIAALQKALAEAHAALWAAHEKLVTTYKVRNIEGDDICDLCGGEIKWPDHKPECDIGQVLTILAPAIRRALAEGK